MLRNAVILGVTASLSMPLSNVGHAEALQSEEPRPANITCLHWWTEKPERKRYLDEVAELFNKKHADITLTMDGAGVFNAPSLLMSAIASGNPPDMVFSSIDVTRYLHLNIPLDLKPWLVADDDAWVKTFLPGMKEFMTYYDGGMYVIPIYLDGVPLNYHKDKVAKTGLPMPKTKEEFYALLDKLKEMGHRPPFELHQSMQDEMLDILVLDYASRDGVDPRDITPGKVPFNSQFVIDALEDFKEMYVRGYLPRNCYSLQGTEGRMKYSLGVMATKMGYYWDVYTHEEFGMLFENQGVWPFPNMSGAKEKWHPASANGCFVVRQTKYPEACAEFLKFLTSKEMQEKLVESLGTKEIGYPLVNRLVPPMSDYAAAYIADLEHGTPYTFCGFDLELAQVFQTNVRSLVKGEITAKEVADKFEELRVRVLAQRKQLRSGQTAK